MCLHDDVIRWKHFPRYWPFVRGIHRSPVNSLHKGQWRGTLMFSLICACTNSWTNNGDAGDMRRHRAHCDVIVTTKVYSSNINLCAFNLLIHFWEHFLSSDKSGHKLIENLHAMWRMIMSCHETYDYFLSISMLVLFGTVFKHILPYWNPIKKKNIWKCWNPCVTSTHAYSYIYIYIYIVSKVMSTVHGQQHSFSTHERMLLRKCQSFWDRKCLDLRRTWTPNLRIHAECSNHFSYQGQIFSGPWFRILALVVNI